jgi:hypothetical protein
MGPVFAPDAAPTVAFLLPEPDKAEPLARKLMGPDAELRREGDRLRVTDGPGLAHRLALPNHGGLTALERMTLRGLAAIAEQERTS